MEENNWANEYYESLEMAKDFSFQFCPGDYLRDTQCLSEKAQVAYDRIMCEHIRNVSNHMQSICISQENITFFAKRLNEDERAELYHVLTKVSGEKSGFQIEWVAEKIAERQRYIESRSGNGGKKHNKAYAKHKKTHDLHGDIDSDSDIDSIGDGKNEKQKKSQNLKSEGIEVMEYLNLVTGSNFQTDNETHLSYVCPRVKKTSVQTCKDVIDCMEYKWTGTEFEQYLRPSTLFSQKNFVKYLDEVRIYNETGKRPTKATNGKPTLKTAKELFAEAKFARDNKITNL